MDYPCHKCSQPVEEGTPFCAHCGAPQIRVMIPEPAANSLPRDDASSPQRLAPGPATTANFLPVQWPRAVQPCLVAALISLGLMFLGLKPYVAALGAGFLSVLFYRQRTPGTVIRLDAGARLGALGGLIFFGLSTIAAALVLALSHKAPDIRRQALDAVQQHPANFTPAQLQPALDLINSPAGFAFLMVFALVFFLVLFLALGSIGGALAGAVFARRQRP